MLFTEKIHRTIFLFGLVSLGFGMMMGSVPTSVPVFVLVINWLVEGDYARKWQQLKSNQLFLMLTAFFLLHVLGCFYSSNTQMALNDLRIKLAFMGLLLVFFSSKPLSEKQFRMFLFFFLAGCLCNTGWCLYYSFVLHHNAVIRDASRFMSHIRLGLYLNISIATCVYFFITTQPNWQRLLFVALAVYFFSAILVLGLFSGLINLTLLVLLSLCLLVLKQNRHIKIVALFTLLLALLALGLFINTAVRLQLTPGTDNYNTIQARNRAGRPLISFDTAGQKENGNYVQLNIELEDLQRAWNKRSPNDTFSIDGAFNLLRYDVLLRYLASRKYPKDAEGVSLLTNNEVKDIQNGVTNYLYPKWGFLHKRLYELVNEYDDFTHGRELNGHSLTLRLYYWRAAVKVILQAPFFGVGTGDAQEALNTVYKSDYKKLKSFWYRRPHNQFLSITVTLGIVGLSLFLISLIYPAVLLRHHFHALYWVYFFTLCVSFLTEDTLDTQAGLSFYAVFTCLFVSQAWFKRQQTPAD